MGAGGCGLGHLFGKRVVQAPVPNKSETVVSRPRANQIFVVPPESARACTARRSPLCSATEVLCPEARRPARLRGDPDAWGYERDEAPAEREQAEIRAGAMTRSELGRLLWSEAPDDQREKARWHHQLSNDEREAMSEYQQYLNNVYNEMIRASLISINDVDATLEQLQMIRPESHRVQTISELVLHIQRISLLGDQGK